MNASRPGSPAIPAQVAVDPASAPRRRPFGLYAILILLSLQALLGAAFVALVGIGMAVATADVWAALAPHWWGMMEAMIIMSVFVFIAVGLWRYQRWAWHGMMLLLAYWMATDAIGYYRGAPNYFSMALNVTMVFYLNQRELRDLFEAPAADKGNT